MSRVRGMGGRGRDAIPRHLAGTDDTVSRVVETLLEQEDKRRSSPMADRERPPVTLRKFSWER